MPTDTQPPVAPILLPSGHWTSLPQVTMHTNLGTVVYDLYPNQTPLSVANWLAYVQACIDPAETAQVRLLMRKPQQVFSFPAPDAGVGGCRSQSSHQ